ncbi:MAG TPA: FAD-dependent oxidoreductase [Jatrophihabitantaceae bacterium]|jgi:3-phenylpropionate/trans-cinnamate dioxygenase ferredoxin reductase subunit
MSTFVIVGGGLAGAKAAEALREQGHDGELVLIGDEQLPPYERPPLSKGYLAGDAQWDDAVVHPEAWYAEQNIDLRLGTRVTALRPADHVIEVGGDELRYDKLLLATGSTPRHLPGDDDLLHFRRRGDSEAVRDRFGQGRMVIVGGGWIGLEVAATARLAGTEVSVLEAAELPLLAALGPELAQDFAALHRDHDVDLRLGVKVDELRKDGVRLADGTTIDAATVLVAIGARPDTELAEAAGLAVDNGVLVDASLRTSDADIFAVGDIANAEHPFLGTRVRVEHWANALNQPSTAAAGMLGREMRYDELPYFYTDQYDLGMEYVGYAPPGWYADVVIRGDRAGREFIAFWLDDTQRVLAGMNVNVWDVVDPIKEIIRSRQPVDVAKLADPEAPLDEVTRR